MGNEYGVYSHSGEMLSWRQGRVRQYFIVMWIWDILTVSENRYQSPNRRDMMSTNLWTKAAIECDCQFFMRYGNSVVVVWSMQCIVVLCKYPAGLWFFPVICCLETKFFYSESIVLVGSFQAINKCNNFQTKWLYLCTIHIYFVYSLNETIMFFTKYSLCSKHLGWVYSLICYGACSWPFLV